MTTSANVDPQEVEKFSKASPTWWDPHGEFKFLHQLNPLRVEYVESQVGNLSGKTVLDLGCGGGILSEALAAKGAKVTGLDASAEAIQIAQLHLHESHRVVDYQHGVVEDFAETHAAGFDIITCMEMLEHVPDPASVLAATARLLKPDGYLVVSTLNRTPTAFLKAIVGAEYVLGLLPKGTHHYEKFIKPAELTTAARAHGLSPLHCQGLTYRLLKNTFELTDDVSVNYFLTFQRRHGSF